MGLRNIHTPFLFEDILGCCYEGLQTFHKTETEKNKELEDKESLRG